MTNSKYPNLATLCEPTFNASSSHLICIVRKRSFLDLEAFEISVFPVYRTSAMTSAETTEIL